MQRYTPRYQKPITPPRQKLRRELVSTVFDCLLDDRPRDQAEKMIRAAARDESEVTAAMKLFDTRLAAGVTL